MAIDAIGKLFSMFVPPLISSYKEWDMFIYIFTAKNKCALFFKKEGCFYVATKINKFCRTLLLNFAFAYLLSSYLSLGVCQYSCRM